MSGMAGSEHKFNEVVRVLEQAARVRADALRTRILALDAFCATAESQLQLNTPGKARISVERIRHTLSEIEGHLQDPHHISPPAATKLWELLEGARPRIRKLERSVGDAG
jgi:hypothetical protein